MYILGRDVKQVSRRLEPDTKQYAVELADFDEHLSADLLIASPDYISSELSASTSSTDHSVVRCIAIIDTPISFSGAGPASETAEEKDDSETRAELVDSEPQAAQDTETSSEVDTALLVFPPASIPGGSETTAASVLITGEGSMSTPRGSCECHCFIDCGYQAHLGPGCEGILYITMPDPGSEQSAETALRPYLDAALTLTVSPASPLFTLFYKESVTKLAPPASDAAQSTLITSPPYAPYLTEVGDSAASNAEAMFWDAVKALTASKRYPKHAAEGETKADEDAKNGPESFWPPLDYVEDDSEEW